MYGHMFDMVRRVTYVRTVMVVVVFVPTECMELNRETQIILLVNVRVPLSNLGFLVLKSSRYCPGKVQVLTGIVLGTTLRVTMWVVRSLPTCVL